MSEVKRSKSRKSNNNEIQDPNEIKGIHQFIMGEKLGQGAFGKVRMATHVITGEKVAIKILEKDKICQQEDKDRVEKEIKILKMIRHNNLIQVYQIIQTPKLIYIVMEYSKGKDLFNHIVNNKRIKEDEACHYFQQIIEGVDFCHKMKICHRDLKPENLLLEDKLLKLIDFGLSNTWGKSGKLRTPCGSPSYAAPEMILGEDDYYGSRVDIWSCGVILYVMICGFLPFEDPNTDKLYKKIIEGKYALPSFVSEPCKDLIRKIMNTDQEKRYTLAEIKLHPWYKSIAPKINEGLLPNLIILPTDEEIMEEMKLKGFNMQEVRESIILNKHNQFTTSYYLLVKSKIRKGLQSESDLFSDRYIQYVKNPDNLLSQYGGDIQEALKARLEAAKKIEEEKEVKKSEPDYSSFNFIKPEEPEKDKDAEELDTDKLINNLTKEEQDNSNDDGKEEQANNPFEVSLIIRNSVKDVGGLNNYEKQGKTVIMDSKKHSRMHSTRLTPVKYQKKWKERNKKISQPRPKNKLTTFDCTDIDTIKSTKNDCAERYLELRDRVQRMRDSLQEVKNKAYYQTFRTTRINDSSKMNTIEDKQSNNQAIMEVESYRASTRKSSMFLKNNEKDYQNSRFRNLKARYNRTNEDVKSELK